MHTSNLRYQHGKIELQGFVAYEDSFSKKRPAVLVAHDWSGRNAFASDKAKMLAKMGYVGFALDMYGDAYIAETIDDKMAKMQPLVNDRRLLRERMEAALNAVKKIPEVDEHKIAAIGFCFGGLCVLDLARSGADIKGVVSFHGLLNKPADLANETVRAKILALHGYDDPMVRPAQVEEFCEEMTKAGADWQMHMYGHTQHAFSNPEAHDKNMGTVYNRVAEQRSLLEMSNFLTEIFL